jgi:hypothetical protein
VGQLAVIAYNYYRFGSVLEYGYLHGSWDANLLVGLYGLLLSPGKGLFVYAPILLIAALGWVHSRPGDQRMLVLGITMVFLIPHALYSNWSGGGGWGPRFLLPILPFLMMLMPRGMSVLSRRSWTQIAGSLILAASLLIQLLSISANWGRHLQRTLDVSQGPEEYVRRVLFDWRYSPILGQVRSLREVVGNLRDPEIAPRLQSMVNEGNATQTRDWQSESVGLLAFNVPDFWLLYFLFLGGNPVTAISIAGGLIAGLGWSGWRVRRGIQAALVKTADPHEGRSRDSAAR